ncbi:DUF58 domain-containing protein [Natrinema sp. 1APR25-10V2]|uniref:DUF58 domain-containing protein n=1 Tax=Natrinema sp. 1APR25-10V2 TaxID=2951081 RepID=UPI0028766EE7|nr:DUF58 domain-containing protein [Natrinema sp. 1APR25-10V2]MDS0475727.1 DUF58 domain-containing protein [Natrinema sp. 1APR25-10V2]
MYPTRRGWTVVGLTVVLAVFAVIIADPLPLIGAALVGAWLLAHQYRFLRDLEQTVASLSVTQTPARTAVQTGAAEAVTLTATRDTETALTLEISGGLPIAATAPESFEVTLTPAAERAAQTLSVTWPVAGRHAFDTATVTATDGLFRETLPVGSSPVVTVEPPTPRSIHVGEGGDRVATAYGAHGAGRTGTGIDPLAVRKYVPGDAGNRIDWKAMARHMRPYVREYEAETDRRTLLVVDHRAALATGPQGGAKLDYLRDVALALAATARRHNDPLKLVTVGDEGVTDRLDMTTASTMSDPVRRRLLELEPTMTADPLRPPGAADAGGVGASGQGSPASAATTRSGTPRSQGRHRQPTPADVRQALADLTDSDDAFARTLRPFYDEQQVYRTRIAEEPLYGAITTEMANTRDRGWTVIFTDDSRPAELRETVMRARRGGTGVTVFLAPSVLYEPGGLADVDRAYERYVEFEEFRRDLARLDDVTALEVGPADRLSTVLEAGRMRGGRA